MRVIEDIKDIPHKCSGHPFDCFGWFIDLPWSSKAVIFFLLFLTIFIILRIFYYMIKDVNLD